MSEGHDAEVVWFVNKPADVSRASLQPFLATGVWESPALDGHAALLEQMRPGEPIALKSVANRRVGLPFFNADQPVSTMTVYATGTIRQIDPETGTIRADWAPLRDPRDWYLWTGMRAVWQVRADLNAFSAALVDFTLRGEPQDLQQFLTDPFWAERYPTQPDFSWIGFYTEMASRLASFHGDRSPLVTALAEAAKDEPLLGYVSHDQYEPGRWGPMTDIDPFSVMATFNRGLTDENRARVARTVAALVGVETPPPSSFDGIPLVNNQASWFFRYAKDRRPQDIDLLWDVFMAALALAEHDSEESRRTFAAAYDAARTVSGVKWNLSQALYWARPESFATLEGQSRPFIRRVLRMSIPGNGDGYLSLLDDLRARFSSRRTSITSFPLLSHAAWSHPRHAVGDGMEGFAAWAARMAESVDLDDIEHTYKRRTAALMARARAEQQVGDPQWPATFKEALLASGNLLHYMVKDDVMKAASANPTLWAGVLGVVWEGMSVDSLDELRDRLALELGRATPGNVTSLGALLLMAGDTEANAPYLTTRTRRWYQLSGFEQSGDPDSPADRYHTLLRFLDALRDEIDRQTGVRVSRLEAQGMAWAATELDPPDDWDEATVQSLRTWRAGQTGGSPNAWLVRAGSESIESWLEDDVVPLTAAGLRRVAPGADVKTIEKRLASRTTDGSARTGLAEEAFAFLSHMRPGDLVCTQADERLHIGRVVGDPVFVGRAEDGQWQRPVRWEVAVPTEPALPSPLPGLLDLQGTVVDLTEGLDALQRLLEAGPVEPPPDELPVGLPAVSSTLAQRLHMPVAHLQDLVDLLEARRQVVLYGPPGTGKTYVALELAAHLVGVDNPSHRQLVQFHPSYAYEDFFEGYRPTETDSGQATFRLHDGPLRRIARDAAKNPQMPFVLVIDEMNRANLAKVFGELYFLLEYRKRSIQLQYRPSEPFRLPDNLYVIGTMNTADRSIALLDAAMRRRFAFVEMHPDEPPVNNVLSTFLGSRGRADDPRAELLRLLNAAIADTDRDFKIGPSYLMRAEAETDPGLERIWRHDILPLLEEHYYGRMTRDAVHARFGLEALRRQLAPPRQPGLEQDAGAE